MDGPVVGIAQRSGSLDGLRGLAALSVLFAHLVMFFGLLPYVPTGGMGVLIFFVLSGYLITGICWRTINNGASYLGFLRRRVQRLGPVNLALTLAVIPILLATENLPRDWVLWSSLIVLTQLTAFATSLGMDLHQTLVATWSMTVEWTFYLVLPLIGMAFKRSYFSERSVSRIFTWAAIALYISGLFLDFRSFYNLPVANLGVMFAGSALALRHASPSEVGSRWDSGWPKFGLALLMILIVLPGNTASWGYKLAVLPASTIATILVINGCRADRAVRGVLETGFLRTIGLRAYSLYVWHMPVVWMVWISVPRWNRYLQSIAALVCLVPVVWLSYLMLEAPNLKSRTHLAPDATLLPDGRIGGSEEKGSFT